jgi:hypothetical protein
MNSNGEDEMSKRSSMLVGLIFLVVCISLSGQQAIGQISDVPKQVVQQIKGTIVSIDEYQVVLSHKTSGKKTEATFAFMEETEQRGVLEVGSKVTVVYRRGTGEKHIALAVRGPNKKKK